MTPFTLEKFNDRQREAVCSDEKKLLILAGAGSGKTRVLTGRIAYLIKEKNIAPWQILAFTFTNKAAGEMKERVAKDLGRDVDSLWIGTFHSLCARLLRREIGILGYNRDFSIYDSGDQQTLAKQIIRDMRLDDKLRAREILNLISEYKNKGFSYEEYKKFGPNGQDPTFSRAFEIYEKRKKDNNALDFDDLILKAIEVLKDPQIKEKYQDQFSYIFVDEYQDTNRPQYELIKLLTKEDTGLFVVGDADQSIYGWRGADINNILDFQRDYPGAKSILLEQNYRSHQNILKAANKIIANNSNRPDKKLWSAGPEGEEIICKSLQSGEEEALWLADQVRELRETGLNYTDIAVLYRTNAQSRPFEDVFLKERIPYKLIGGLRFYDRAEVKDLIAYMSLSVNPLDDLAFRRIVNTPRRGIGDKSLEDLSRLAEEAGMSLYQALSDPDVFGDLSPVQKDRFGLFRDLMFQIEEKTEGSIKDLINFIYDKSGYRMMLDRSDKIEDQSRKENIGAFIDAAAQYEEEEEEASLRDYLQNLALLSDLDKSSDKDEGVKLLTMHSAKGLEFPVVFIVGLEEGLFPSSRSLEEGELEEERRLMYVAMTRAERRLFLSYAAARRIYGSPTLTMPSRFIDELDGTIVMDQGSFIGSSFSSFTYSAGSSFAGGGTFAQAKARSEYDEKRAAFRRMLTEKNKQKKESNNEFRVGDKIVHKKFGQGTVVAINKRDNGDELTVAFDKKGIKSLSASIAPIKKL